MIIEEDDGLSSKICQICYFELQRIYLFKTKCEYSQTVLMQLRNVKIKIRKLKSDKSNEIIKDKPTVVNGLSHAKYMTTIEHATNSAEFNAIADNAEPSNLSTKSNPVSTNYVEFIDDPLNLIQFEQLSGSHGDATVDMDLDNVIIKEEPSDLCEAIEEDVFNDPDNNAANSLPDVRGNQILVAEHEVNQASEDENFECPACPYVHVSAEGLEKHLIKNHIIGNMCTICNTAIIGSQRQHFATHMGSQLEYNQIIGEPALTGYDFQCPFCTKRFKLQIDVDEHIAKDHIARNSKIEKLTVNGLNKGVSDDLFDEIIEETFEDDIFECSICFQPFSEAKELEEHKKIHVPEVLFKCEFCAKTFLSQDDLNQHAESLHPVQNINGQQVFKCNPCAQAFNEKSALIAHLEMHEMEKPFKCDQCAQTFRFKHNLNCHIRFKHCTDCKGMKNNDCKRCLVKQNEKQGYECDICHKVLSNKSSMPRHRKMHMEGKPYKCELCSQSFNYKQILNLHIRERHGEKNIKSNPEFQCKTCLQTFERKVDLTQHMKSHEPNKLHQCPHCLKNFELYTVFIRHVSTHSGGEGFKCVLCSEKFTSERHFRTHIAEKHVDGREETGCYKCEDCGKIFAVRSHYDEHVRTHTKETPYQCETCKQSFRFIQSLNRHKKLYHTKDLTSYQCQLCPKSFRDRCDLVKHFRNHTGEKPFQCEICSEKFSDKLKLGAHMLLKHDAKNVQKQYFKCEQCSKVFWYEHHYNVHLRSHTGETPFRCDICNHSFRYKQSLKQHIEKFHKNNGEQQRQESAEQNGNSSETSVVVNENTTIYGNNDVNNFAFGDSILNADQMMNVDPPENMMSELFDDSSIEVA
ncbi:zinc finger protein 429-like isoform X2 [Hermetia illucens]|uniref:zinc finger protein 429-like isoform X2 n=1 Tax=Hermetia illucens TaxID=343691 RepID=UPI0018CC0FE8|nr:zinc finger protein 429-like isoform X2 [Hermetia illucens]